MITTLPAPSRVMYLYDKKWGLLPFLPEHTDVPKLPSDKLTPIASSALKENDELKTLEAASKGLKNKISALNLSKMALTAAYVLAFVAFVVAFTALTVFMGPAAPVWVGLAIKISFIVGGTSFLLFAPHAGQKVRDHFDPKIMEASKQLKTNEERITELRKILSQPVDLENTN